MIAKLIFFPEDSSLKSQLDALVSCKTETVFDYQWVTGDLTSGKLITLLVCLDELGFLSIGTSSGSETPSASG